MNDFVNSGLGLSNGESNAQALGNPANSFTASKEDVQAYEARKIEEAIAVHDRAHQRPAKLFGGDEGPSAFQRQNEAATAAAIAAHDRAQAQRAADKAHKDAMDAMLKRDRPGYSISDGDNGEAGVLGTLRTPMGRPVSSFEADNKTVVTFTAGDGAKAHMTVEAALVSGLLRRNAMGHLYDPADPRTGTANPFRQARR